MDKVFAVTVVWNNIEDTTKCLDSLLQQEEINLEIIIIDNGSTAETYTALHKKYPTLTLLRSEKNLGFAGGFNFGIRYALDQGAENILILNNDTIADPKMCTNLFQAMVTENASIVSPIIFFADSPQKIWSSGGYIRPFLLEPQNAHGRNEELSDIPTIRTFLSGCCMLINRCVFDAIGLFDERFFLYYEDLDFCLRLYKKGIKMMVVPMAKLWHKVSISSGGNLSPDERYFMAYSSCLYFRKHITWKNGLLVVFYRIGSALLWTLRLLVKGNIIALRAFWRGLWQGLFA